MKNFAGLGSADKEVKELAAEINISERVLYRYFSSLYEKTGTSFRIGLLLLYYGGKEPPEKGRRVKAPLSHGSYRTSITDASITSAYRASAKTMTGKFMQ
jgi:hypothetical protein